MLACAAALDSETRINQILRRFLFWIDICQVSIKIRIIAGQISPSSVACVVNTVVTGSRMMRHARDRHPPHPFMKMSQNPPALCRYAQMPEKFRHAEPERHDVIHLADRNPPIGMP